MKLMSLFKKQLVLIFILSFNVFSSVEIDRAFKRKLNSLLQISEMKAFLDTIAYAEGTYHEKGYNLLFGGHIFKNFSDHPRCVICSKPYAFTKNINALCSSAAGRYQILERTWDKISKKLRLRDFKPESQDRAAIGLIYQVGAVDDILNGRFETAVKKVAVEWASFPESPYGQPIVPMNKLRNFYLSRLEIYKKK